FAVGESNVAGVIARRRLQPPPVADVVAAEPLGDAVPGQEPREERLLLGDVRAEPLEVRGERLVRGDAGAGALANRLRQPRVIRVLVRDEHELDVLEADLRLPEPR